MNQTRDLADTTTPTAFAARYRDLAEVDDPRALAALYHDDVLVDTHVPNWRFQLQGGVAAAERACALPRPGRFTAFDVEPTASGSLVQFEWRRDPPHDEVVRQLHVWRFVDGRIAEQVVFCAGVWDRRLQQLMATKAPLVRP